MKRPRRNHTAVFEAKVALAALRVDGKRDDGKRDVHCFTGKRAGKRDVHCFIIWITTSPVLQPRSALPGRPTG